MKKTVSAIVQYIYNTFSHKEGHCLALHSWLASEMRNIMSFPNQMVNSVVLLYIL